MRETWKLSDGRGMLTLRGHRVAAWAFGVESIICIGAGYRRLCEGHALWGAWGLFVGSIVLAMAMNQWWIAERKSRHG